MGGETMYEIAKFAEKVGVSIERIEKDKFLMDKYRKFSLCRDKALVEIHAAKKHVSGDMTVKSSAQRQAMKDIKQALLDCVNHS